jgi:hypothetical protein
MWKNDPRGKAEEHWLDVISDDIDGSPWYQASIKWDGCVDLNIAGNLPFSSENGFANQARKEGACDNYVHICDLNNLIGRLTSLRDTAKKHFGDDWGNT